MSWGIGEDSGVKYDVRMKLINASVTPQNRLILCVPIPVTSGDESTTRSKAHLKLEQAYRRAHGTSANADVREPCWNWALIGRKDIVANWIRVGVGFAFGVVLTATIRTAATNRERCT